MSNLINLNNIVYQVDKKYILKDVNCHINKNGILSILGPNGAGKTTLLKIMAGLIKPTSGSIKFNYKLPIGFVFQKPVLLNRSVEYNLIHALRRWDTAFNKRKSHVRINRISVNRDT